MSSFEAVVGGWTDWVGRLERSGTLAVWRSAEPALGAVSALHQLSEVVRRDTDHAEADEVLAALVRLAARDGGDQPDAALVVVHLLRDGVEGLARRFRHRGPDVMAMVVGELTCQIRTFPWRTSRPYPGRLLLDTKHALWNGEFRPIVDGRLPHEAIPIDPMEWRRHLTAVEEPDDIDLIDVLSWATSTGIVSEDDLRLLLALEEHRGYGNQARQRVADQWGINERTVRRRRDRALGKLRAAADHYLSAVA